VQKPSLPKGTRDFGPQESIKRNYLIQAIRQQFVKYGFMPLETPAMENLSVLMGKYGEEGDQLVFKILNSGDFLKKSSRSDFEKGSQHLLPSLAEKGLRYDLTVPLARYVVMNQHALTFPFKRYQIQPVWRADRPQKGRYREFYQCDADIIGTRSDWNEVELTLLLHDVFESLKLRDFVLKINHRDVLFAMAAASGMSGREIDFCVVLDKLDKIGEPAVLEEMASKGGNTHKLKEFLDLLAGTTSSVERLKKMGEQLPASKGIEQLLAYFSQLEAFSDRQFKIELDFSLARGLTYYTGMIFEVKPTSVKMGSICGGGRYDNLTGVFGLPDVSGIGISFGLDRIYDVLEELQLFPESTQQTTTVLITHFDQESFGHGKKMVEKLRKEGLPCDLYPEPGKIKKQFNYANKLNIPYVITIGSEEITTEKYPFKEMSTGHQASLTLDQIISRLKGND